MFVKVQFEKYLYRNISIAGLEFVNGIGLFRHHSLSKVKGVIAIEYELLLVALYAITLLALR